MKIYVHVQAECRLKQVNEQKTPKTEFINVFAVKLKALFLFQMGKKI